MNSGYAYEDTWSVQTGDPGKTVDYGLVSDGHGFEDSPDSERICGGVNTKGPRAVAIGRQANMLQWGFYAAPDRMTASAQKAFLNAIVYMRRFDGDRPLVEKVSRGRAWLGQFIEGVRALDPAERAGKDGRAKYLVNRFPAAAMAEAGLDADALDKWLAQNIEFVRGTRGFDFVIDEDLKKLGLSNRKPEFVEWLIQQLRAKEDPLAPALAARYLGPVGADAEKALAWLEENRQWLFFSDVGGYRWFVDENQKGAARPQSDR